MNRDRADIQSDKIEAETLGKVDDLYNAALVRALRKSSVALDKLKALEKAKPPALYQGDPETWRRKQRQKIIKESGMARSIARELVAAGVAAGDLILDSMALIDEANRKGENIGLS